MIYTIFDKSIERNWGMRRFTALGLGLAIAGCLGLPIHVNAENKPDPFDDPFFQPDRDAPAETTSICSFFNYYDSRCAVPITISEDKKSVNSAPNISHKQLPKTAPGAKPKR
jgi:hypothetical protein